MSSVWRGWILARGVTRPPRSPIPSTSTLALPLRRGLATPYPPSRRGEEPPSSPTSGGTRSGPNRAPRNEEITAEMVQLVNPRHEANPEEARLVAPAPTREILARLDLDKTVLVLVDGSVEPPVCKLVPRSELYRFEKAAQKTQRAAKKSGGLPKEINLTWAVTRNDLGHKLRAAVKAIADNQKATVIVSTPPGSLGTTSRAKKPEEKKALVGSIEAMLTEAGGHKVEEAFEGAGVKTMTQKWEKKPAS